MQYYEAESTKKTGPFLQHSLCLVSLVAICVLIKGHFRDCVRTGIVYFCCQSAPVNVRVQEDGALAPCQRMTLAKPFNLFEPQFSHLLNERKNNLPLCSLSGELNSFGL